jgi:dimethylhistidine N-methyltransferase
MNNLFSLHPTSTYFQEESALKNEMIPKPAYRIVDHLNIDEAAERANLIAGLRAPRATIEPKYFYDELGCALYAAICQLDEYYPTRTERSIFQSYRGEIAAMMGTVDTFIDLGAGDCCKAMGWLPFVAPKRYLAVDIAAPSLRTALDKMSADFPETEMIGLATDFSSQLDIPAELLLGRTTLFYPGSSIGNFTPDAAVRFMRDMRRHASGGLLIGVDAKKDKALLDAAYADELGVTAAFNLNALRHINRVLGSDFDERKWRHVGQYNEALGRIEMHLESIEAQRVMIDGVARAYRQGERIHSENSYKYDRDAFAALLREAGFDNVTCWTDAAQLFWVFYAV